MNEESRSVDWVRPAERPFVRRGEEWAEKVIDRNQMHLTDFLTVREQYLLVSIARNRGLVVEFFGGHDKSERSRGIIMPGFWYPASEDYRIEALRLTPIGTGEFTHGNVLGSILGTGIDRRKVGDIGLVGDHAICFVCLETADFLATNLSRVGRVAVTVEREQGTVEWVESPYELDTISAASLRLDAVLGQACHWSRTKAQEAIRRGMVTLNFAECDQVDETVAPGDLLSVRGFGRVQIRDILGVSKKERLRLEIGVLRSQR